MGEVLPRTSAGTFRVKRALLRRSLPTSLRSTACSASVRAGRRSSHLDRAAGLRALVDGTDERHRVACVAPANRRLPVFTNGVAQVLDLPAIAFRADREWIRHAAADIRAATI